MSLELLLQGLIDALKENTASHKANAGNAALAAGASDDKLKKATHFHLSEQKKVVKVEAGGERPLGGLEVTAAEAKKLDEKYKADEAKNASQTGATGAQTPVTGTTTAGDGPSFQNVTDKITELSKKKAEDGGGRPALLKLFEQWGVKTFPEANGKKSNAELLADIEAALNPPKAEDTGLGDLGL